MTLREIILSSPDLNEGLVVYAKRVGGQFAGSSEAVLLDLTEDERELNTNEVAKIKCPGFSYCLEMFLIQEMMEGLDKDSSKREKEERVARILYFMDYDA